VRRLGNHTYQVIVTNLALRPLHLWRFYLTGVRVPSW